MSLLSYKGTEENLEMVKTHSACTVKCSELDIRFSFDFGRSSFKQFRTG